jgi:RNA polymerase sigma-B factor
VSVLATPAFPRVTTGAAYPLRGDDARLRAYARTRDPALRQRLIERYMPLAGYAAARFRRGSEPFDDLLQVASIGLINAVDRFDPDKGASFSSYALPTMLGELRRHFRDRGWIVRPPRDLQEDAIKVERTTQAIRAEHGATPSVEDVARCCELSTEGVIEARQALEGRHATSLSGVGEDDEGHGLEDRLGIVDDGFDRVEQRAMIDRLSTALPRRDREIVWLRFAHDLTQAEIGAMVGLSQMHVSRVLRHALETLRAAAAETAPAAAPAD